MLFFEVLNRSTQNVLSLATSKNTGVLCARFMLHTIIFDLLLETIFSYILSPFISLLLQSFFKMKFTLAAALTALVSTAFAQTTLNAGVAVTHPGLGVS